MSDMKDAFENTAKDVLYTYVTARFEGWLYDQCVLYGKKYAEQCTFEMFIKDNPPQKMVDDFMKLIGQDM